MTLFAHRFPRLAPFSMFAGDSFYYLDVARNSQGKPFYTFDGLHATNGFHPIWQLLLFLGVKYGFLDFSNTIRALTHMFYANLVILSIACACLSIFCARHLRHKWIALLSICPGWLWFIVAVSAPDYLSNWSYLNGMETSIELLFFSFALLSYRPSAPPARWLPIMCFFLGATVLSRLDDVFFLLPLLAFLTWKAQAASRRIVILSAAIPLIMIAAYLSYNIYSVHRAMPISGASKAGLALYPNIAGIAKVFLPTHWDLPRASSTLGYSVFAEGFMRTFQMIFPMLLCGLYLFRTRSGHRGIMDALCIGVLLKGGYNFLFVSLWSQGHWYYGASIFLGNLVLSLLFDTVLTTSLKGADLSARLEFALVFSEILAILFSFNVFVNDKLNEGTGYHAETIFEGGPRIAQMVRAAGGDKFVEFDDGILGFSTDMGSISGIGLVLDAEAFASRKQRHFFDLAVARGDQFVLSDAAYARWAGEIQPAGCVHAKSSFIRHRKQ